MQTLREGLHTGRGEIDGETANTVHYQAYVQDAHEQVPFQADMRDGELMRLYVEKVLTMPTLFYNGNGEITHRNRLEEYLYCAWILMSKQQRKLKGQGWWKGPRVSYI